MEKTKIDGLSIEEALKALNEDYTEKEALTEAFNNENGVEAWSKNEQEMFNAAAKILKLEDFTMNQEGYGENAQAFISFIKNEEKIVRTLPMSLAHCNSVDDAVEFLKYEFPEISESLNESSDVDTNPVIPAPYDKYFTVSDYDPEEFAGEYLVGDTIENYDSKLLAYLEVKPEYESLFDGWALLIDDPEFPVVELAGDRMYPLDVKSVFEEALTESNSNFMDDVE